MQDNIMQGVKFSAPFKQEVHPVNYHRFVTLVRETHVRCYGNEPDTITIFSPFAHGQLTTYCMAESHDRSGLC
jgi:hypothetical protein